MRKHNWTRLIIESIPDRATWLSHSYSDREHDWVTIASETEWRDAVEEQRKLYMSNFHHTMKFTVRSKAFNQRKQSVDYSATVSTIIQQTSQALNALMQETSEALNSLQRQIEDSEEIERGMSWVKETSKDIENSLGQVVTGISEFVLQTPLNEQEETVVSEDQELSPQEMDEISTSDYDWRQTKITDFIPFTIETKEIDVIHVDTESSSRSDTSSLSSSDSSELMEDDWEEEQEDDEEFEILNPLAREFNSDMICNIVMDEEEPTPTPAPVPVIPEYQFQNSLDSLVAMGFDNVEQNKKWLDKFKGDISKAVARLLQ